VGYPIKLPGTGPSTSGFRHPPRRPRLRPGGRDDHEGELLLVPAPSSLSASASGSWRDGARAATESSAPRE